MHELLQDLNSNGERKFGLYSLDIETTGINSKKDKIWSIGMYANRDMNQSLERHIGGIIPQGSTQPMQDFVEANTKGLSKSFGKQQLARGSFDAYIDDYNNNKLNTVSDVLNEISTATRNKPGIMLIQNAQFEMNFFSAQRFDPTQGVDEAFIKNFSQDMFGISSSKNPFVKAYDSSDFSRKYLEYLKDDVITGQEALAKPSDKLQGLLKASEELEDKMVDTIRKNYDKGFQTVTDLMDTSKMYLLDLHAQGAIDSNILRLGQNVEFLAEAILQQKELHVSLWDGKQQSEILEDISARRHNIKHQGLQQVDRDFVKALLDPQTGIKAFRRSVSSELQSIDKEAFGKLSPAKRASLIQSKLSNSLVNHQHTETQNFDKIGFTGSILKAHEEGVALEDLIERVDTKANNWGVPSGSSASGAITAKVKQATSSPEGLKEVISDMSPKAKTFSAAALMVGAGLLSSGPRKDKEDVKRRTNQDTYNELYDNVYAGQAYADWTVRNQAHKMSYN